MHKPIAIVTHGIRTVSVQILDGLKQAGERCIARCIIFGRQRFFGCCDGIVRRCTALLHCSVRAGAEQRET